MCSMIERGAADIDVGNVPLLHGRVDHLNVIWGQFLSGVVIDAVVGVFLAFPDAPSGLTWRRRALSRPIWAIAWFPEALRYFFCHVGVFWAVWVLT